MRRFHKVNFAMAAILLIVNIIFAGSLIKEFEFPAYLLQFDYRDGYSLITLKGCNLTLQEVGKPIIPFANLNVLIPPSAEITNIEILDLKRTEIPGEYLLYPAQEPIPTSFQGEKPFISPDVATYQLTSEYPAKITEIIPSGNKSEFRIGGVFLYPVQYIPNQKKLVLYERIKIKINYEKGKHEVQPLTQSQKELFSNEVKTLVINPEDINRFSPPIRVTDNPDADYIILTSSTLESRCTPLVNWIRKTGMWADTFNTTWVSSNYTGRDLQEKIRKFIIDYYTNHGLKYVLLAGDVSVIPQRGAYANVNTSPATIDSFIPCDLYYADLQYSWDGNQNNIFGDNFTISGKKDTVDLYYDVYLGRWPVETSAEIDTMIRKYMTYVKNPDTSYEKRMLLPYGSLWAGYSGKASQDSIANYTPSGWTDRYINNTQVINEVRDSLNNGFGFCHLCGHGNEYGVYWTSSGPDMYTTTYSHPSSQTNYNKLVIANSNACYSGSFDYSDCLAEEMMKARGSAIAVMMNSRYGWGYSTGPIGPSELLDVQFYNYVFCRDSVRIANCHQASKQVYRSSAYSDQLWRWCYCELNLFGEPEMMLWKDNPKKIVAKFSNSIGTGSQSFAVICSSQSTPLSGAIVSLWKGSEVFIHGTTNASGQVNLSINPTSTGYMYVIVTAKNKIPCEDSCNVLNLYLNDVGVDAIIYPTSLHSLNTPVAPIGRVKNYGSSTQTNFQVICSIVGTTSKSSTKKIGQGFSFVKSLNDLSMEKVLYQEWTPFNSNEYIIRYIDTLRVTSLAPGETTRVSFRSWTPTFAEMCTVKMRTNLVGDQNSANDLTTRTTQITVTIIVSSPNGGETLTGGSNRTIKWRTVGYGAYRIILSRNSGSTYTDTIANNVALTETTYNWFVPTLNLNTCRVLVQILDAGGSVIAQDASDADFTIDSDPPSVPNLASPINGAMINNVNVSFIWNRSTDNLSGILRYTLEYARNSGFTSPIDTVVTDSFITLTLTDTTYYWRVKVHDRAGNQSSWSSSRSFEVDTRIPNAPTLTSPINGIWSTSTEVIFNWSQVTLDAKSPVRYILQVDTTTNFNAPINDTTSYVYDTLVLTQARYYWRVSAYDLAGNQGNFSQRDSFRVDNTTPSVPNLISPANSAMIDNANILFVWNRSTDNLSGISSYILQYAKNSGFTTPRDTIISDTMCTITLTDTTYYWHVKAQDRAGNQSSWSSSRSFEVDTRIPNALTLVSPINGVWLTNTTVIFNWSSVTLDTKSPVRYIIQVDTSATFTSSLTDTTSYLCDTLTLINARYNWRVRAYDLAGNQGAFSNRDSFGADNTDPSVPNLISPANGVILIDSFVRFYWNRSTDNISGIRNYQIQIANNSNFVNPIDTLVSDSTIMRRLSDTTYYWHVKAIDRANNESNWSNPRSFNVITTSISESYEYYPSRITALNALNPNPVTNGRAHISFTLAEPSPVSLKIYDVSGQLIRTLVNTHLQQGIYDYSWNCRDDYGRNVAEGVYFYTLETPRQKFIKKLIFMQ